MLEETLVAAKFQMCPPESSDVFAIIRRRAAATAGGNAATGNRQPTAGSALI